MSIPTWKLVKDEYERGGLSSVFLRRLGWNRADPSLPKTTTVGPISWAWSVAGQIHGAAFIEVQDLNRESPEEHRRLAQHLSKYFPEIALRFHSKDHETWYWPKKLASGGMTLEGIPVKPGTLPDFLAQRLAGLRFDDSQLASLTPAAVRERMRGMSETTRITKDFYTRFEKKHTELTAAIQGLPEDVAGEYATLLLNRLMFIWFLQKKEFLNGDSTYLRTCLKSLSALSQRQSFYSFYRDYLLDLFFNHLNSRDHSQSNPELAQIIGDIPYVNGGIFGATQAELEYQIEIPDEVFDSIFSFFESYTWHLDTRPTGAEGEINPEVIGYIFEQYINVTSSGKKESGAYYTPNDVTSYIVSATVSGKVLDTLLELDIPVWAQLVREPKLYLRPSVTHGSIETSSKTIFSWMPLPQAVQERLDSGQRNFEVFKDLPWDGSVQLPGESWLETLDRRKHAQDLALRLNQAEVSDTNGVVLENINIEKLIIDVIYDIDFETASKLWDAFSSLAIVDPTCGSGAFLFAAMESLETFYAALVERFMEIGVLPESLAGLTLENRAYFLRKHIALKNLYGVDIMPGAIETAKLRIFLALTSCVHSREELEPLPDLDFNLQVGNFLVGFTSFEETLNSAKDLLSSLELQAVTPALEEFRKSLDDFRNTSLRASSTSESLAHAKQVVAASRVEIKRVLDKYLYQLASIYGDFDLETWVRTVNPSHWYLNFPEVMSRGGFDCVIGNPPYIPKSHIKEPMYLASIRLLDLAENYHDVYELCVSRSLAITTETGRMGLVVMSALAIGDKTERLRSEIAAEARAEFWSTYAVRPAGLFEGILVRNTILILGPKATHRSWSSQNNVFSATTRSWLFECLRYYPFVRAATETPLRGGPANSLARRLLSAKQIADTLERDPAVRVAFRASGKYWFPVLIGDPVKINPNTRERSIDTVAKTSRLFAKEPKEIAIAISAGKIAAFNWGFLGDDFNVSGKDSEGLRALLASLWQDSEVLNAAQRVLRSGESQIVLSSKSNAWYPNVNWIKCGNETDDFDLLVLQKLGLEESWEQVNLWYARNMRMTREDNSRVRISAKDAKDLLGW